VRETRSPELLRYSGDAGLPFGLYIFLQATPAESTVPNPYIVLGVTDADDDGTIRRRYLQLVLQFPPEQHPELFTQIRTAYDRIRTLHLRAEFRLSAQYETEKLDEMIEEIACRIPLPRPSLSSLLASLHPTPAPPT